MRLLSLARRMAGKSPLYVARRAVSELVRRVDRSRIPGRVGRFDQAALLRALGAGGIDEAWERLGDRPYFAAKDLTADEVERFCPGMLRSLASSADRAVRREVDLLGSGPVALGERIRWHVDYKTSLGWPERTAFGVDYGNPDRPSDVKFPWELSRLQWLLPAAQRHLVEPDERLAVAARDLLADWIAENGYAGSINWACTMEAALRIPTWTFLFHAFHRSRAWADPAFRCTFLRSLFLHADFTERYIERSDINGNHFTADAAGLVFAGLFFGGDGAPQRWLDRGWRALSIEIGRQVLPDGVDFEASAAYHRLVTELFLLPALYRERCGIRTPRPYVEKLEAMARFVSAYSRPDGSSPLWGDADDGRALPLGDQPLLDHRYLVGLVAAQWGDDGLRSVCSGPHAEILWLLGPKACAGLQERTGVLPASGAFPDGGVFIMRRGRNHVFIDCGPVGLAGRGGHGHNDCLAFEAMLEGCLLVTDCGSYVYTASYADRNRFRSTGSHNTPQVDAEELNRFPGPLDIWSLRYDAVPSLREFTPGPASDRFVGTHRGYQRLPGSPQPQRTIVLDHDRSALVIQDEIRGVGSHGVEIPLHLGIGVTVEPGAPEVMTLRLGAAEFTLLWEGIGWTCSVENARCSPSYGACHPIRRLVWRRSGMLPATLRMCLAPTRESARLALDAHAPPA
jgi:hypothetical protein